MAIQVKRLKSFSSTLIDAFNFLEIGYRSRQKCSFCGSRHRYATYEYKDTDLPGTIFYSEECWKNYIKDGYV